MNPMIEACRNCLTAQPSEKRSCGLDDRANPLIIQLGKRTMSRGRATLEFGQMMSWADENNCPLTEEFRIGRPIHKIIYGDRPFTRPSRSVAKRSPHADYTNALFLRKGTPQR